MAYYASKTTIDGRVVSIKDAEARQAITDLAADVVKSLNDIRDEFNTELERISGGSYIVDVTEDKTLVLDDYCTMQRVIADSLDEIITITIPSHYSVPFPVGNTEIEIAQYGQSGVVISGESGVIIRSMDDMTEIAGQYGIVTLKKIAENEWLLGGALA